MNLYKRFNNKSMNTKPFTTTNNPNENPENYGFVLRQFKINCEEELLEIKNIKNRHIEQKLPLSKIKGILIDSNTKSFIKQKKNSTYIPNQEVTKLLTPDYIRLDLLIEDGKIDIIAPSYLAYNTLNNALDEIIKNKKNLYGILNYLDK
jgi:hypothetical protein